MNNGLEERVRQALMSRKNFTKPNRLDVETIRLLCEEFVSEPDLSWKKLGARVGVSGTTARYHVLRAARAALREEPST